MKTELLIILWFGFVWNICWFTKWLWRRMQADLAKKLKTAIEETSGEEE